MPQPYADFAASFPWFLPLCAFVFGAIVGSFLNVVIYRVPAGRSVVTPGSHCGCGAPIRWFDNLPILSWLLLRGRARCCGRRFSIRYPAIEALTGALFVACWLHFPPAKAACGMLFMSILVCATFIDLDHMIIPDAFTIWSALLGLALALFVPALHVGPQHGVPIDNLRGFTTALHGLLVGSALVLWIRLLGEVVLRKEAMGFGDVVFVGMIGTFTGWQGAVTSIFGGAIVGTVWFLLALLLRPLVRLFRPVSGQNPTVPTPSLATLSPRLAAAVAAEEARHAEEARPLGMGVEVPFGPMLAIAGGLHFLVFAPFVARYFANLGDLFAP